jgi:hypothetical protein
MRIRSRIAPIVCLLVGLGCLTGFGTAMAQDIAMESPFFAPPLKPSLYGGLFYVDGGARWRSLLKVEFRSLDRQPAAAGGSFFHLDVTKLNNTVWSPFIEVGCQSSDFFDLFAGFSWYTLKAPLFFESQGFNAAGPVAGTVQDYISNLKMNAYEFRSGGRSWFPIYGLGRISVTAGVITTFIPYEIQLNSQIFAGGALQESVNVTRKDWWVHMAGFLGTELELGFNRFFVRTSAEFSYGSQRQDKDLYGVEINVNPCGLAVAAAGGIRF